MDAKKRLLIICSSLHMINHSYTNILPPILPAIIAEFGLSNTSAGLLLSTYYVMYGLLQLPMGYLADRVAARLLLVPSLVLSSLGLVATTVSQSIWHLFASIGLIGIGGSTYHPVGLSHLGNAFSAEERGRTIGFHGLAASLGFFISPVMAGILLAYGWRMPLFFFGGLGISMAILVWKAAPPLMRTVEKRGGIKHESALRALNRNSWIVIASKSLFLFTSNGFSSFIPVFLVNFYNFNTQTASLIFSVISGIGLISGPLGGYASDRVGRVRILLLISIVIATAAFFMSIPMPATILVVVFLVLGAAEHAFVPVNDALMADLTPSSSRGMGFGVLYAISFVTQSFSPMIMGGLIDLLGFHTTFLIGAIITTPNIFLYLLTTKLKKQVVDELEKA